MKKLCIVLAFGLVAGTGGCSNISRALCVEGTETPDGAVSAFIKAVTENNPDEAQQFLHPRFTVDEVEFDALRDSLDGTDYANLIFVEMDQAGSQYHFQVAEPNGPALIERINVATNEDNPSCYSVAWGNFPEIPDDPSSSPATTP